jgi:SDR family mycofactocin-dependent oxidoreductase
MSKRRSALVIGGARGIGAATAAALARDGNHVTIVDRAADDPRLPYALATNDDLTAAVAAAREAAAAADTEVVGVTADACDEPAMREVVAAIEARAGRLDAVVVTAGVVAGGVPIWELPERELEAVLDVDLRAVIIAARAGIPAILRTPTPRSGRFVAIASTAASRGLPMLSAYCAAKAGVVGFVRALAAELRGHGITANAVSPGSTDTAILAETARLYALAGAGDFAPQQPIERLIEPAEIADVVAFLAGPTSGAITGAEHAVDGGLSI